MKLKKISMICIILVFAFTGCGLQQDLTEVSSQSNSSTSQFNSIMETEDGYYYNALDVMSMHYVDKKTGETLYLCSKPECLHDGNGFCLATNNKFSVMNTALYEDAIYIQVAERTENQTKYKLLQASKDGTELTEVSTFCQCENPLLSITGSMVFEQGVVYIPYKILYGGGSYITAINLKSGKSKTIAEYPSGNLVDLMCSGEYLYYRMVESGGRITIPGDLITNGVKDTLWENAEIIRELKGGIIPGDCSSLYRYCMTSESTEKIEIPEDFESITIIDDKIYYTRRYDLNVYLYSLDENTTELFLQDVFSVEVEIITEDGSTKITKTVPRMIDIMYDGTYLWAAKHARFYSGDWKDATGKKCEEVLVYDLQGNPLGGFIPKDDTNLLKADYKNELYSINVVNDTVYIQSKESVVACSVEDIINDNIQWKLVYLIE